MNVGDLYFQTDPYRDCTIIAVKAAGGDAHVSIKRGQETLSEFMYPAYKVWNLEAHDIDIIDDLLGENDGSGFAVAGSDLLGGCVMPRDVDAAIEAASKEGVDEP